MVRSFEVVGILVAIWAAFKVAEKISLYRRFKIAQRAHGCKPARRLPSWDPFLGLDVFAFLGIKTLRGERSDEFVKIHRKYGPTFEMKCLSQRKMVQTSSEKNLHCVTATNFNDWGVAPARQGVASPFMENGVFTDDGQPWRHARALIRPTFTRSEIADLEYFETFVQRFLALFPEDGSEFDMLPLAKRLVSK
jgi:cytochrome P450